MLEGNDPSSPREQWRSQFGFLLATLAASVGIGNVWRFAYVAGENGGAAFILVYILAVLLIGWPVMLAEFAAGSRSRADAVAAFRAPGASPGWAAAGAFVTLTAFLILAYYAVVAGWATRYFVRYSVGAETRAEQAALDFTRFLAGPEPLLWHSLFMAATAAFVAAGVQQGIEKLCRLLMPLLAGIVLVLAIYSLSLGGAAQALSFLFAPDWSRLADPALYLAAIGQALFSIGVGAGVLLTYASYAGADHNLPRAAMTIAAGDTLFAIVAGLAIFPAVFAFGLDPAHGPALAFITLPKVFAAMEGGTLFAIAFFGLLSAAALTSAISLLEVSVAWAMRRFQWRRLPATLVIAGCALALGVPAALSSSVFVSLAPLGRDVFGAMDFIAGDLMLPLGALATALFVGYALSGDEARKASGISGATAAGVWLWTLRAIAPLGIALAVLSLALS